jgi:plastocyanin
MRRSLVALTIALTAALAACTSSTAPGWTFAPPTPPPAVTPAPSVDPSAAPSAPASEAPSAAPSDDGGAGSGEPVLISALGIKFEQAEVSAPAGVPFLIRFDNKDAGIPHNVEIKDPSGASVFKGEIFNGTAVKDYQVGALAAGTYQFICTVHPNMVGTLAVGG